MKWADFVKERVIPAADVENVGKLVADVTNQGKDNLLGWLCRSRAE